MALIKLLPKSALSSLVGRATRARAPARIHQAAIRVFAKRYGVTLEEAEHELGAYRTFGEFFSRGLRPGLRPIAPGEEVVVSPVDGAVSQAGTVASGECIQAKGISYPLWRLLASRSEADRFDGGSFATLYLSPKDYHRIHAPLSGQILGYSYVPGQFWPVNPASVRGKQALFCVNERLITFLSTKVGRCAVVKVGATCVSRIRANYEDDLVTHQGRSAKVFHFPAPIPIAKGQELGRFEMGSTVILVFERGRVRWDPFLQPEAVVRMGQRIGEGGPAPGSRP